MYQDAKLVQRDRMRNIKLILEYDGTNYHGWQKQPKLPTIQNTVEVALTQLTKTPILIVGAGRTDTGVHAEGQVVNFFTELSIPTIAFQKGLNTFLPHDIVVIDVDEVSNDFHARFSAISRRYRYTILNRYYPSALRRHTAYLYSSTSGRLEKLLLKMMYLMRRHTVIQTNIICVSIRKRCLRTKKR